MNRNRLLTYFQLVSIGLVVSANALAQSAQKVVVVPMLGGSEAKTETQSLRHNLPAAAFMIGFQGFDDPTRFSYGLGQYFELINNSPVVSIGLITPVDLPQGAEITAVRCYLRDSETDYNLRDNSNVSVYRRAFLNPDPELIMPAMSLQTSGDDASVDEFVGTTLTYPVIDNDAYFYHMRVFYQIGGNNNEIVSAPVNADIQFLGCSIHYDLDVLVAE